jgi:hypothetical protein
MKQTSDVPQTATPNAAIALVIVCSGSVALGGAWLCAAKTYPKWPSLVAKYGNSVH